MKLFLSLAVLLSTPATAIPAETTGNPAVEGISVWDTVDTHSAPPPCPVPGVTLHLSPQGDDTWPGTAEKPFATLERCRDEIRALKKKGALPVGGILVQIHGGEYPATQTFSLSQEDSGTDAAPIRYAAAPGEKPIFRGGKRLTIWRKLTEADNYPLLPKESRDQVWLTDLKAAGIENVLPLKLGGFGSGNGFVTYPAHELFFNGRAMLLARGPKEGYLRIKDVTVKDGHKDGGREGSLTGSFFYDGNLPDKWAGEPDLLLYGYWFWDWADSYERVASVDSEKKIITLAKPWHTYGFRAGAPYYAVNALSELDAPGEWYLDRGRNILLFYPPSDPQEAVIELSTNPGPLLDAEHVSHLIFEGITWDLGSADALQINGADHCFLLGCTISRFAGNGLEMHNAHANGIFSCDISSMGRGGVVLDGGDRRTLEPGKNVVENCDIHDLSRIDHTYTPAVHLTGVGNRIAHNHFHDIPSSALNIEGNDEVIEYNDVDHVVTESDDQGGSDTWGDPTFRGNVFRFNYWHDIGNDKNNGKKEAVGQDGIRLDDFISDVRIYGNIFEHCSVAHFGAVQMNGGNDNTIENNLFIDCASCLSLQRKTDAEWRASVEKCLSRVDAGIYQKRYPEMSTIFENKNTNRASRNLTLRCEKFLLNPPQGGDFTDGTPLLDANFSMKSPPKIFQQEGFDPIPIDEIGLYTDSWRKK